MLMNWPKEMEAILADDHRFERKKSRFSENIAFFYEQKEIAHFHPGGIDIRLTAAGIFALRAQLARESVVSVAKDWVLLRLASEADLKFAREILDRAVREAHKHQQGPKGKQTRRKPSASGTSDATRAFGIAKALKDLEELNPAKDRKR